jgi:curved DNA-binding protein CbpA
MALALPSGGSSPGGTEILDESAIGVSAEELESAQKSRDRFGYIGERLDFSVSPRPENVKKFFEGEYDPSKRGVRNPVNNPLSLIRPESIHTLSSLYERNGNSHVSVAYYKDPNSPERGYKDRECESDYVSIIKAFEGLYLTILESLNNPDKDARRDAVMKVLEHFFAEKRQIHDFDKKVPAISKVDNPAGWLLYTVLSVLDNPSEEISPVGRLRALELLSLFESDQLAEGFRSDKYNCKYYNGYDRSHLAKLPYTFCSREERSDENHRDKWQKNPLIQTVVVKDGDGKIDWRSSMAVILEKYPREAVQLALLFLHDNQTSVGGIQLLRSIPSLARETQAVILDQKATFMVEHKLGKGDAEAVLEGLGLAAPTGVVMDISERTREELTQFLARQTQLSMHLEFQAAVLQQRASEIAWKNFELGQVVRDQQAELAYWRAGVRPTVVADESRQRNPEDVFKKMDPMGYLRVLGLHPMAFEDLDDNDIKELVGRQYKYFASKFHPDHQSGGKADEDKMKLLNEARDVLVDKVKRARYLSH